jgi:hypothetical protein
MGSGEVMCLTTWRRMTHYKKQFMQNGNVEMQWNNIKKCTFDR